MLETFTRYWWAVALRGAAAVLFGLMALIWPGITLLALVIVFGAYALVDGVLALVAALGKGDPAVTDKSSRVWLGVQGAASIVLGILALVWPGVTALALLWVIAVWAMATGILEIIAAVRLRRELRREWLLALSGALTFLFGLLLVIWPAAGALTLVVLIGVSALIFGVTLLAFGLRLRRQRRAGLSVAHHRRRAEA
jgi:uncharacterized membrane protein HdeD (DUF308 family)